MSATFKPARPRVRLRRSETAEKLLDGAFDIFAEKGFEATTIDDICARVHMTRGAFYSSFKTKEDLFEALFTLQMTRLIERLQRLWHGVERHKAPLSAAAERYIATELHDVRWYRLLAEHRQMVSRSPEGTENSEALAKKFSRALGSSLSDLMMACGRTLDVPEDDMAAAYSALVEAANWRATTDPHGAEAFVRNFLPRLLLSASIPASSTPDLTSK